jgi:hypothetical protein
MVSLLVVEGSNERGPVKRDNVFEIWWELHRPMNEIVSLGQRNEMSPLSSVPQPFISDWNELVGIFASHIFSVKLLLLCQ